MWIKLIASSIDATHFIQTYLVSDDVPHLRVKVGGTDQTFVKSEANEVTIKAPINLCLGGYAQIYTENDLFATLKLLDKITLNQIDNILSDEFKSFIMQTSTELIEIDSPIRTEGFIDNRTMTEVDEYASKSNVNTYDEYSRGLNDGLILGQMI